MRIVKKKIPKFKSDKSAESFVARANLAEYDLSSFRPMRLKVARQQRDLPLLRAVRPLGLYRVRVTWSGGRGSDVDLAPHILRYAVYRPLRENVDAFKAMKVIDGGVAVEWAEAGANMSADSIAALERAQTMSATEFRSCLEKLGLSFDAAAAALGISRRQVAYYASGAKPLPRHLVAAVREIERGPHGGAVNLSAAEQQKLFIEEALETAIESIERQRRAPDKLEQICIAEAIGHVLMGRYRLALGRVRDLSLPKSKFDLASIHGDSVEKVDLSELRRMLGYVKGVPALDRPLINLRGQS